MKIRFQLGSEEAAGEVRGKFRDGRLRVQTPLGEWFTVRMEAGRYVSDAESHYPTEKRQKIEPARRANVLEQSSLF